MTPDSVSSGLVALDPADGKVTRLHPRTLVGWDDLGSMWFVVVDGRQAHSRGLTLDESRELLVRQLLEHADESGSDLQLLAGSYDLAETRGSRRPGAPGFRQVVQSDDPRFTESVRTALASRWSPTPA